MVLTETTDIIRTSYGAKLKQMSIERISLGLFFGGIKLSDGSSGISYMPVEAMHNNHGHKSTSFPGIGPGALKGAPVSMILDEQSPSPLISVVQLLLLNALSQPLLKQRSYRIIYDQDVLDILDIGSATRIAMVGAITPFLKVFRDKKGLTLHVIEKKKQSLSDRDKKYYVPSEGAEAIIPLCDTVIITGATVANGTIDELLSHSKFAARVIITGPTVSFLPDALFKKHVHIVSGTIVTDIDKALDILAEGGGAYHLFKTSCLRKINIIRDGRNDWINL